MSPDGPRHFVVAVATGETAAVYGDRVAASDDPGFEIGLTPVGGQPPDGRPGRPNRPRLKIIAVLVVMLAIPAVAIAGPRMEWRPIDLSALIPTPTPIPSPTVRPTETPVPTATPLPPLTIATGPLPTGPVPIDALGFRLIDPSTGTLGPIADLRLDNDAVFREVGGDGWWCVCFGHQQLESSESVDVTVRHFDVNLGEIERFEIATYKSVAPLTGQDFSTRFDLERSADGRIAYLAVGERNLEQWMVRVDAIDMEHGRLLGSTKLATIRLPAQAQPSPSLNGDSPIDSYLDGPTMRLSPDGRQLVVVVSVNPNTESGQPARHAWFVNVAGDLSTKPIGSLRPIDAHLLEQLASCGLLTWLGPDELLMTCWDALGVSSRPKISASTFDVAGRQTGGASFELSEGAQYAAPLIDKANRLVYYWEPDTHTLHRLDLQRGGSDYLVVDPATTDLSNLVQIVGPIPTQPPVWATGSSDFPSYSWPQLIGEPGGTRVYALGLATPGTALASRDWRFGSSGVWVFDTAAFALVDHWPAAAAYTSIALSPDGRWLTAAGQSGIDVAGDPAGWGSSVSIHDTVDGRLALQLGQLGEINVLTMP
jgi:hypothetical protein